MQSDLMPTFRRSPVETGRHPGGAEADRDNGGVAAAVAALLGHYFGGPPPVRVEFWDGTCLGPAEGPVLQVRSPDAVRRLLWSPGELGLARAFVVGRPGVRG